MLPFPEKFLDFHPSKFLMTFFLFSLLCYISPCFAKIIISSLLSKLSPPVFEKFTCFLHTLCVFRFPPTLTRMHLCITQCTYWTPLPMNRLNRGQCDEPRTDPMRYTEEYEFAV